MAILRGEKLGRWRYLTDFIDVIYETSLLSANLVGACSQQPWSFKSPYKTLTYNNVILIKLSSL